MTGDRYLKFILTAIALELLWIGVNHATPVATAQGAITPVIIRGVQMDGFNGGFLPVGVVGTYRQIPITEAGALEPMVTRVQGPVLIESQTPLKIEADRPLRVESVDYAPRVRPGE